MHGPRCADTNLQVLAESLQGCVTTFALAVKNLTIYPADHPRVVALAERFAEQFAAASTTNVELACHADEVRLHGQTVASDNPAVAWLARRCRDLGVGAIAIDHGCTAGDVVQFAVELVRCRPGSGLSMPAQWPHGLSPVRPIELVVGDRRATGTTAVADAPPPTGTAPLAGVAPNVAEHLRALAGRPGIQSLVEALVELDTVARTRPAARSIGATASGIEVDILAAIGQLIPADGPAELEEVASAVERILLQTLGEALELSRTDSRVRGAEVMRQAIEVARSYFGRAAPEQTAPNARPQGRAGDDKITADLDALLREVAELPSADDLRLPTLAETTNGAEPITRELLGICLHLLGPTTEPRRRRALLQRIGTFAAQLPDAGASMLRPHLAAAAGASRHQRLSLLRELHGAGLGPILTGRGYVDDALLRAGFPEVLEVAALLFDETTDAPRLRAAFDDIAPLLDNGGAAAAGQSGMLDGPATLSMLVRVGGSRATQLLGHCRDQDALRATLVAQAERLRIPPVELAVLRHLPARRLPRGLLSRILDACGTGTFDAGTRDVCAELLCTHLDTHAKAAPAVMLAPMIEALGHATCERSSRCLEGLSRIGRFSLAPELRRIRTMAAQSMAQRTIGSRHQPGPVAHTRQ